jgi:hypothetical protein
VVVERAAGEHPGLPIICKIDCEGCEFEIVPAADSRAALAELSQVMIEYHWQSPDSLVTALKESGFEVETSRGAPGVGWVRAMRFGTRDGSSESLN